MQHNPYATPVAELSENTVEAPGFFVVSIWKLIVMNISTLGFYGVYWLYKNWKNYKLASGRNIYPIARVVFSVIYIFPLFSLIHKELQSRGEKSLCPPYLLACLVILLAFSETLSVWVLSSPFSPGMKYGVMAVQLGLLIYVQQMINRAEGDPKGKSNSCLTPLNYFWIFVGLALWGLIIYAVTVLLLDGELPFGIRL